MNYPKMRLPVMLLISIFFAGIPIQLVYAQSLEYVGSALWSNPTDVVVDSNYAYCSYQAGLVILNISNPTNPSFVSRLYIPGPQGLHLRKAGDYIYFVEEYEGLRIIDVSNPTTPTLIAEYSNGAIADVFVSGQYAYVVGSGNFRILNISDPYHPVLIGEHIKNSSFTSVWVAGDYAYVTAYADTMMIFNISDPANPQIAGYYGDYMNYYNDIWIKGNLAFMTVADSYPEMELLIADISDPIHPVVISQYGNDNCFNCQFFLNDNKAYITQGEFEILNITNPASPSFWYRYGGNSNETSIFVRGNYAYYTDVPRALEVVNVLDEPTLIGSYETPYISTDLAVRGDYAYVTSTCLDGLRILNISNPEEPVLVGHDTTVCYPALICVDSTYAYVTDYGTFRVIDISNPILPHARGQCVISSAASEIAVSGDYVYLVDGDLRVINVSNHAAPRIVSNYATPGFAYGVCISDNYAYIADGYDGGLQKIDITDPIHPVLATSYNTPGCARDICVDGEYAYLADDTSGVQIFNISDPDTLMKIGHIAERQQLVAVAEGKLYLAPSGYSFKVYDVADPANPAFIASYMYPYIGRFCVSGDNIFINKTYSILILQLNQTDVRTDINLPIADQLLSNYPNPFNAQTTISYNLPEAGPVRLSIYNILGQRAETLLDAPQQAGEHSLVWDASILPSGIYFARLEMGKESQNIKLLLLK